MCSISCSNVEKSRSVETSRAVTSTTGTGFDSKDRETTTSVTTTLSGSQTVPVVTTRYDDATGATTNSAR